MLQVSGPNGTAGSPYDLVTTSYAHGADYWLAFANANLHEICNKDFDSDVKAYFYAQAWFMRSLIPSLFDPSVDAYDCPLSPGDFHSHNIMITDVDSNPRITAIIDWVYSGSDFAADFTQYPLFIVDHPDWNGDNPLRRRNIHTRTLSTRSFSKQNAIVIQSAAYPFHVSFPIATASISSNRQYISPTRTVLFIPNFSI